MFPYAHIGMSFYLQSLHPALKSQIFPWSSDINGGNRGEGNEGVVLMLVDMTEIVGTVVGGSESGDAYVVVGSNGQLQPQWHGSEKSTIMSQFRKTNNATIQKQPTLQRVIVTTFANYCIRQSTSSFPTPNKGAGITKRGRKREKQVRCRRK